MRSQWPDNCHPIMWIMISNSLDINFIHGDIHSRSCQKLVLLSSVWIMISSTATSLLPLIPSGGFLHHYLGQTYMQNCGHASIQLFVTLWNTYLWNCWIDFPWNCLDLSLCNVMVICPICPCPWTKNLSNLVQVGSRLCGMQCLLLLFRQEWK